MTLVLVLPGSRLEAELAARAAVAERAGPDACVEWPGAKQSRGYGCVCRLRRHYLAHRLAWIEAHGPIPAGQVVRHRCDNPPCVRLSHLMLGTQADNLLDAVARGSIRTACDPEVARRLVVVEGMSDRRAAKALGVSRSAVRSALRRAA